MYTYIHIHAYIYIYIYNIYIYMHIWDLLWAIWSPGVRVQVGPERKVIAQYHDRDYLISLETLKQVHELGYVEPQDLRTSCICCPEGLARNRNQK